MATVIVIGDVILDLVAVLHAPLALGADTTAEMREVPGGAGANVAAWLARVGVETHLVGRIGRDALGEALARGLQQDGVVTHLVADPARPSGRIVVLVDGTGERTMITDRGANLGLRCSDLPADLFAPGRHLHLSGYSLFVAGPRRVARRALRQAAACGMTVSLDPASASLLAAVGPRRFVAWTRGAHLLFPNAAECALLSGRSDPAAGAAALRRYYEAVVVTRGAAGALHVGGEGVVAVAAAPARVVDTMGAGDAFCAGFLAAWLAGASPPQALEQGSTLAAQVVAQLGSRPPGRL